MEREKPNSTALKSEINNGHPGLMILVGGRESAMKGKSIVGPMERGISDASLVGLSPAIEDGGIEIS